MGTKPQRSFDDRLKRIQSPKNRVWVDPETGIKVPRNISTGKNQTERPEYGGLFHKITVVWALAIGVAYVIGAQAVRWHLMGGTEAPFVGDIALAFDIGVAFTLVIVLRGWITMKSKAHFLAQVCGIVLGISASHNLVWMYPSQFASMFSPEWVNTVQAATEPKSLQFRDISIPLGA